MTAKEELIHWLMNRTPEQAKKLLDNWGTISNLLDNDRGSLPAYIENLFSEVNEG